MYNQIGEQKDFNNDNMNEIFKQMLKDAPDNLQSMGKFLHKIHKVIEKANKK